MQLLLGQDEAVAAWAGAQLGTVFHAPFVAFGVLDSQGSLRGAAVWNDYHAGGNISLSLVGPGAFQRGILRELARYAFEICKCSRVSCRTRRANISARKLLPKGGFVFEGTARRFFGPTRADDGLSFVMFPEQARKWLKS